MKRLLSLAALTLVLAACVDTTGISADSSRPARGNPQAAVTVAEFADLQCPACRAAHTALVKPLLEKYGTQIRYEYHHFPLQSLHRYALDLAEAAECSADQQKFWEFVDMAFAKQTEIQAAGNQLAASDITSWAKELNLNMDLFDRCTKSHIKRKEILADYDAGQKAGVQGTPTFFVNGQQVESTPQALGAAIEAAVKGTMQRL
jgi:protein-disulfide isomerase